MSVSTGIFIRAPGEASLCHVVDRLPKGLRSLVHDYGIHVVQSFVQKGVTNAADIRFLIRAVHLGAREPKQATQPIGRPCRAVVSHVDAYLLRAGAGLPFAPIVQSMREVAWTALATSPTNAMVAASMATVTDNDVRVGKQEKHFRRLQAALHAGDFENWGAP